MTAAILTDPTKSTHTIIEEARKQAFPSATIIKVFREYARGYQKGTYNNRQEKMLRGVTGNRYSDNICRKVIEETANRLELARYQVDNEAVSVFLNDLFVKNQMADLSGDVHYSTLRDGNFCVSLQWVGYAGLGRVVLHKERWWDGREGIFVAYGPLGQPAYAFKDWELDTGQKRRVIWWPDRIERYIQNGSGWQPYQLPEDAGQWPVPWVRPDGRTPLGIPVVHFANGSDDDTFYGASELDGGILGLQDEINDMQRNLTLAARMTGAQMMWASGVTLEKDSQGRDKPLEIGPGAVFTSKDAAARYGTLPAGDLSQLESAYMVKLQAVARMTNTPIHLITGGDWPSGEALLQATQPLIKKVERLAKTIGPAWATLAHIATEMANVFGNERLEEDALITAVFSAADKRDPLTQSQIAAGVAPFVSEREVLRVLGYGPDAVDRILKERQEEQAQQQVASAADVVPQLPQGRQQ